MNNIINGTQWMYKGRTLSALKFQSFFPENVSCSIKALQDRQTVSSFLHDKLTTSPVQGKSEISTVKEQSHMAHTL